MNVLKLAEEDGCTGRKVSTRKGGEYHGPCPGCGGKDRFLIWPEQNGGEGSWWCRICGQGGDLIQYLREFRGMSFKDAAAMSSRPTSPKAPGATPKPQAFAPRRMESPKEMWRCKSNALVTWAHRKLLQTPSALDMLAARGIGLEAVKAFRLGWNPGEQGRDCYRDRTAWGLPEEFKDNGKPKKLWIPRGFVIPTFRDGLLYRVRIRRTAPREFGPKYYVLPGSGMGPMILHEDAKAFVVVEAELDAIACAAATGSTIGAVGLGSISTKPDEFGHKVFQKSLCILNALDFEPAQDEGADPKVAKSEEMKKRIRGWWQKTYSQAKRWPVPVGKDPGEAVAEGVQLREWIRAGLSPAFLVAASKKEKRAEAPAKIPQAVIEFQRELTGKPISMELSGESGAELIFDDKWAQAHWNEFRRLADRFWEPEIMEWMEALPVNRVSAENILKYCKN
ncbi:primase-helicase zinc-binding domain-containing protein [Desulfobaculum bizertense]|uniref:Zinc-binding domain of primase-helicase n=1 Tax=Desulfobaculum bizertense DSM 18034 TaxID=1121442 RepID=A0A1T4X269_9BACT|nr:primase-helicase zinc-binding domain-containing protein [Desulfobaculum bizertense]SKA83690.1 Zinc-binding domain of primase-helicase [Desulfobaculum bizertense DSM 18034]